MEDVLELGALEGAEPIEEGAEGAEPQQTDPAQQDATATPITSLFDDGGQKINPAVKAILGKLRAENPGAEKLLSKAIFRYAELEREFPAGLTEIREMRDKVAGFGGLEGIEEKLRSAVDFSNLAGSFEAADPAFVQDLVESYPESFKALGPVFLQQYAQADPEAFSAYIGRAMYSDFSSTGFLLTFQRLADFLPADNARAAETYGALANYLKEVGALANKAPATPKAKAPAAKTGDRDQREYELTSREWKIERDGLHKGIASKAYREALGARQVDSEDKAAISELFLSRAANLTRQAFPDLEKRLEGFIARKDKAGYFRYLNTVYQRVIPTAVKSAIDATLRHKATGKTVTTTVVKPGQALPQQQKRLAAPAGFTPVAKAPGTWEIDYNQTSKTMLANNQAVLKGDKKVSWR